ncbi:MAG: hypothetical protein WA701_16235 [Solirubrobacterales bacterium]
MSSLSLTRHHPPAHWLRDKSLARDAVSTQLDSGMDDGQIVEENLMYDLVTFMKQLGLSD